MANIQDGTAFVAGRNVATVRRLLAISDELKIDQRLVQTRSGGYEVPVKVADAYEKEQAEASKSEADEAPAKTATKASTRKAPAKK